MTRQKEQEDLAEKCQRIGKGNHMTTFLSSISTCEHGWKNDVPHNPQSQERTTATNIVIKHCKTKPITLHHLFCFKLLSAMFPKDTNLHTKHMHTERALLQNNNSTGQQHSACSNSTAQLPSPVQHYQHLEYWSTSLTASSSASTSSVLQEPNSLGFFPQSMWKFFLLCTP